MGMKILFKVFDKQLNLISKPFDLWATVIDFTDCKGIGTIRSLRPDDELRLFTGMTDVDGVQIFRKDIVEFDDYGTKKRATVEWNNRSHSFVLSSPSYGKNFTRLSGRGKLKVVAYEH